MANQPGQEAVHIDAAMTAVSVAYRPNGYVAELVFKGIPVNKKSDKYFIRDKEAWREDITASTGGDLRRPGDSPREVRWSLSNDTYSCECHSRSGITPDEIRENADPAISADIETTELTTAKILLFEELNFRAVIQDTTNVFVTAEGDNPPGTTANASRRDYSSGSGKKWYIDGLTEVTDPSEHADFARALVASRCGETPNVVLMNRKVASRIKHNKLIKDRFKYSENSVGPLARDEAYKDLFQVDTILIADSIINTSAFGAAPVGATTDFLLGNHVWMFYVPPNPGPRTTAFAYTFLWNVAGGQSGTIVESERLGGGRKSDASHVHKYYDQKVVDRYAAYMFQNVI